MSFQVFAWGCGSCLGCGSSETTSLRPRFIEDLSITKIIDISCGDSHCLALSHGKRELCVCRTDGAAAMTAKVNPLTVRLSLENEVYAWGNNTMGQCGQGHTSTPITRPKKVLGLEGVSIQQITAGTSHSLAWTAVPTDRCSLSTVKTRLGISKDVVCCLFSNCASLLSPQTTGCVAPALLRRPGGEHVLLPAEFSGELLRRY